MRKIFFFTFQLLFTLLLLSCYGGNDREAFQNLQQVTRVEGISADDYTLYQGDTLRIHPAVTFSDGADTTVYSYRWVIGKSRIIGNDRNLEWPINLPSGYNMAANIPGSFIVHNKLNGLEFRQTFTFKVLSNYTPSYVAVYEKGDGRLEWMSLQGTPDHFTRWFDDMIARINPSNPLRGNYRGTLYSMNELAVFTDHADDYGRTISMKNADPQGGFPYQLGEYTGAVKGNVYKGTEQPLRFSDVTFGYGASKYLIMNKVLYVFNGLDRKLPIYNEQTFVKSRDVKQAMSSKQFQRFKKITFVLHNDGRVGCYHVYNDEMQWVTVNGQTLRLDSLAGCFTEATGLGANQSYNVYLVGRQGTQYKMYQFLVKYVSRVVQPASLVRIMDVDAAFAASVKRWWGSFGENYGFYLQGNSVYRFDYYEMTSCQPSLAQNIITFGSEYEVVDVLPQITGSGLRDEDYLTVALLYDRVKNTSSLCVFNTVSGALIRQYTDIIPGRVVWLGKCL